MSDEWREHAACAGTPVYVMVPEKGQNGQVKRAKAVCATCDQHEPCLAFAMATDEHGIWAGTTYEDRRRLSGRARQRRKHPGPAVQPINHGSVGGSLAHRRRGVLPVCDACKAAWNADRAARRKAVT